MKTVKLNEAMILGGVARAKGEFVVVKDSFKEGAVITRDVEKKQREELEALERRLPSPISIKPISK